MSIEQIRGDTKKYNFQRINFDGNPILQKADKIYFTVKKKFTDSKFVIQKTIDDMTFDEEGIYHFTIESKDTDKLSYGTYVFDIEVIDKNVKTTLCRDEFKITEEVTFSENES